jgi:hypothetical protein
MSSHVGRATSGAQEELYTAKEEGDERLSSSTRGEWPQESHACSDDDVSPSLGPRGLWNVDTREADLIKSPICMTMTCLGKKQQAPLPTSNSLPSTIIPVSARRSSAMLNTPPATMLYKRLNILSSNIIRNSKEAPTPHIGKGRSLATVKGLRASIRISDEDDKDTEDIEG